MPESKPNIEEILASLEESLTILAERIASLERKATDDYFEMIQEMRITNNKLEQLSNEINSLGNQISHLEGRID